jgi:hypothetical protein
VAGETAEAISKLFSKLDDLRDQVSGIDNKLIKFEERCGPCRDVVRRHDALLYGNGTEGLHTRVAKIEDRAKTNVGARVDRVSIKGMAALLGAVGTLAAALGGSAAMLLRPPQTQQQQAQQHVDQDHAQPETSRTR